MKKQILQMAIAVPYIRTSEITISDINVTPYLSKYGSRYGSKYGSRYGSKETSDYDCK